MGEHSPQRRALTAAAAALSAAALALVVGWALAPAGGPLLSPGRAEASCARSLVYDGVYWLQQDATQPIELGDAVDGAAFAPCNDSGAAVDREDPVDAYRVPALGPDYLATSTGRSDLFRRTSDPYVTSFGAENALDVIALVLVLAGVVAAAGALIAWIVRRRRASG
jgi:hypothetical protein